MDMANRHDLMTRKAYKYHLKLTFFDIAARKEIIRYADRITRAGSDEVVRAEFLRHPDDKTYILTNVEILEIYQNLYAMSPDDFYQSAEIIETVVIK